MGKSNDIVILRIGSRSCPIEAVQIPLYILPVSRKTNVTIGVKRR